MSGAQADLITNGFTFAVATNGSNTVAGDHFHSNTGGSFGNPAGKAEVGRFTTEEVRGLSEYSLSGLTSATSAFVTFDVFKEGGLFTANSTPFTGSILVEAYVGNNQENISDYQAATVATIGSFSVDPAALDVGDIFSFDITDVFNDLVGDGASSLGIRLREDPGNADYALSRAWVFEDFRLTTDSQCTVDCGGGAGSDLPEPGSLALVGLALAGASLVRRRR